MFAIYNYAHLLTQFGQDAAFGSPAINFKIVYRHGFYTPVINALIFFGLNEFTGNGFLLRFRILITVPLMI